MKKVFIVHGFQGSPNGDWRPHLLAELEKLHIYACALAMPNPNNPVPSEWIGEISRHVSLSKRDQIYLIGHSLGVPAILQYLQKTDATNIQGIILVSGPIFKTTKRKVAAFLAKAFDFKKIRAKVKHITVIHGDNDRAVSFKQGEFAASKLGAKLIVIKGGGHLNGASGCLELPECLAALKRML